MADRRRTISNSQQGQYPAVPSSIPRPSTAMRQSLAPASIGTSMGIGRAGRQSMAPYASASAGYDHGGSQGSQGVFSQGHGGPARPEPPMTASRAGHMYTSGGAIALGGSMSVARSQGALRSSMAPGGGGMAMQFEYAPPSERRTSTYRRSTMGPSGGPGPNMLTMTPGGGISASTLIRPAKDPREPRRKEVRERYADDVVQFLAAHQYPYALELKQLLQPTGTQFQQVFKFLINLFDPSINFGAPPERGQQKVKFEDEVLNTLRTVQYPFTESISKSHLQAIGSAQSWPNMLAMLHWLVMTIDNRTIAFTSDPELHMPAADHALRAAQEDVTAHAWLHFVSSAYNKFLVGQEEESWEDDWENFQATVDNSRQAQRERLQELEREAQELQKEWEQLTAEDDPIHAYKKHTAAVRSDRQKCDDYIASLSKKMEAYKVQKGIETDAIEAARQERETKFAEQKRLEAQVKAQKLTPLEIATLNSDKQHLNKALKDVAAKYRVVVSKTMSLEIDLQKQLNAAQALCTEYEEKANPLGILDGPIEIDGIDGEVHFGQEVNGAAENPVPEGLTTVIKPALQKLRARTRDEIREKSERQVELEEQVTKVKEAIAEHLDVQAGLDIELQAVDNDKTELGKRIDSEMATTNSELERLQTQVHMVSSTADHVLAAATYRYEQRVLERMQVHEQTSALRRANRAALEAAIEQFMNYKEHMCAQTDKLASMLDEADADLPMAIKGGVRV
ncbi:hypothetical protein JCM1840_005931 [Sporobolomyces johnsonii]